MYDFISLGEVLIDFVPIFNKDNGKLLYEQHFGGAPANVALMLSALGWSTGFIGKLGNDQFGHFCRDTLKSQAVDISNLLMSDDHNTTLAFVHLTKEGDRDFSFYRENMADTSLEIKELSSDMLSNTKFFHFGSVSLTHNPVKETTIYAMKKAKRKGALISYDPNLRPALWESLDLAKKRIISVMEYVDLLKVSHEESEFLFGKSNLEEAAIYISEEFSIPFVVITRGRFGSIAYVNNSIYKSYAYDVKTINTTGAGDAALAGIIHNLLKYEKDISKLTKNEITYLLDYSNAMGSLITAQDGIIFDSLFDEEVKRCMKETPKLLNDVY